MMRIRTFAVVAMLLALAVLLWPKAATQQVVRPASRGVDSPQPAWSRPTPRPTDPLPAFLPREARETVAAIQHGGPFMHRQDGAVFGNREDRLPRQQRGFYREYTVVTPGVNHRGARRIVTGGHPPQTWYYTDDHYDSFQAFQVGNSRALERQ